MKNLMILTSVALALGSATAGVAKVDKPDKPPVSGPRACLLTDVSPKALACTGFFDGNLLNNKQVAAQTSALKTLGFAWDGDFNAVSKIDSLDGATLVDFGDLKTNSVDTLYGDTWVGVHFGNGAGLGGQVTGFWKIDAGLEGLSSFLLNITKGSSGAVLYSTQSAPKGGGGIKPDVGNVPEPANWAMMIAGFGLVGATMRRRRTAIA